MIFNRKGLKVENKYSFTLSGKKLEITDQYQYLGIKLKQSGSFTLAIQELNDKATRAWYGISNIIVRNKRMQVDRILSLFDSLITPVATYGSQIWLPFNIKLKDFDSKSTILNAWENFKCEVVQ